MAHTTVFPIPVTSFIGDTDAQLVAGDTAAAIVNHKGRPGFAFDDTDEEAIVSAEMVVPGSYAAGTLTAAVYFAMESDNTNDVALDVFVEAKTPNTDTLDMESAIAGIPSTRAPSHCPGRRPVTC